MALIQGAILEGKVADDPRLETPMTIDAVYEAARISMEQTLPFPVNDASKFNRAQAILDFMELPIEWPEQTSVLPDYRKLLHALEKGLKEHKQSKTLGEFAQMLAELDKLDGPRLGDVAISLPGHLEATNDILFAVSEKLGLKDPVQLTRGKDHTISFS